MSVGITACFLILLVLMVIVPWASPNVNALLRFTGAPRPILAERGELTEAVNVLLARAEEAVYVAPSSEEMQAMREAAEMVTLSLKLNNATLLAEASKAADRAGYEIVEFADASGLSVLSLRERADAQRGRGTFLFRRDHFDGQLIIVAPHALADGQTGPIGLESFIRIPGADALLLSGTASDYIDEAHTEHTIFNTVFRAIMRPQATCLSLHGFNEEKPGRESYPEIVISSGAIHEPLIQRVHTALFDELSKSLRVGIYDGRRFADVAGTRDQQGIATSSVNSLFVHLEFSRAFRRDPARRNHLLTALAGVLGNVGSEIVANYAQPSRDTLIQFTTVAMPPVEFLIKHGHNAAWISSRQMRRLRLRTGEPVLISQADRHAVARVYSYQGPDEKIYLGGAMRRRLGVEPGSSQIRLSRLPE